jgi:hypothetical protein
MLDLFPLSVWSNPSLKWLDPSAGVGFFMIFVYMRLMDGLKKWEPNSKKRSIHIISSMLYMVEINPTNCNLCKTIFGANLKLICGDFLADFKIDKRDDISFDCIVGNPPFQDDVAVNSRGSRINGGKNKLYERIFLKAYTMLNSDGIITFVTPDNIFSGNGQEAYRILQEGNVEFVSFNPSNQLYFPGIQQYICYFIFCKIDKIDKIDKIETVIETSDTNKIKIKLKNRPVNPVRNWSLKTERLITQFVSIKKNNVRYNRGKRVGSYRGKKYPIIYTPSKTLYTNKLELASGWGQKKAILYSMSVDLKFKMDYIGNVGAGPNTFIIPFNTISEGKHLEKFLNSDEYKTLALATKTSRQYLKISLIEHLCLEKIMMKSKTRKHNNKHNNKTRKHF